MFTGLVTDIGTVRALERRGDLRAVIETRLDTARLSIGASIACSGVCLTVVEAGGGTFAVDISAETLARTTLGGWKTGTPVNLEPALRVGDELGGHLVSGHVDGLATVTSVTPAGDSHTLAFAVPAPLRRFLAEKGSVCLDGVSLTVNAVDAEGFRVNIIPHTWRHTTLGAAVPGAALNLEVDTVARYLARLMGDYSETK